MDLHSRAVRLQVLLLLNQNHIYKTIIHSSFIQINFDASAYNNIKNLVEEHEGCEPG